MRKQNMKYNNLTPRRLSPLIGTFANNEDPNKILHSANKIDLQ